MYTNSNISGAHPKTKKLPIAKLMQMQLCLNIHKGFVHIMVM